MFSKRSRRSKAVFRHLVYVKFPATTWPYRIIPFTAHPATSGRTVHFAILPATYFAYIGADGGSPRRGRTRAFRGPAERGEGEHGSAVAGREQTAQARKNHSRVSDTAGPPTLWGGRERGGKGSCRCQGLIQNRPFNVPRQARDCVRLRRFLSFCSLGSLEVIYLYS